ncbi:MAG: substrate-binding domain-containing protein [Planctomycetota bacterium]|nr:substrate-binding domain-containing protein [Planctomycetota bacterium]
MKHYSWFVLSPLALLSLVACGGQTGGDASAVSWPELAPGSKPQLAFVTNCVAEFWTVATFGVEQAREEFDVDVSVHMPADGTPEQQKKILEDLLAKGVHGIALSPKNPGDSKRLLNEVADSTRLVTHDSDAPETRRLAYVGMENYDAGRLCGKLVKEAIPDGGAVVILVGNLDQHNAQGRRQGVIDELLDRPHDSSRFDPQDAELRGDKYEIRATFTDDFNHPKCKANAQDALVRWDDIACMVGLFEYEPPLLLEAVKSADRLGKVAVVGFDENAATLQGIVDGEIYGTVVQNPYEYARKSLELLSKLTRESDPAKHQALLPENGFVDIPARGIRSDNVQDFWDDLKEKTGKQ